jgi:acyl-CoA synthetase (AMP-forming)/AMP-acid ligase II
MDENGYVFIVDRIKDMIITGGENVYSAEVENALAGHPAVAACAVIGVPDPDWGERVHAVVVLLPGQQATAEDIRAHCKTLIAGYKAPRSVDFVDALPMSGAGKILKRDLRERYWDDSGTQAS